MKDYLSFLRANPRFLAFGFALCFFSSFGQTFFLSLFSAELRGRFDLSHGDFGRLYSLATLASGLTMLWLGRQIDRYDLQRFTLAVAIGLVASAFLVSVVNGTAMLLLAIFAMRLTGQGLMGHTAATSMARYFERGRGKAISLAMLGYAAGEAVFPPLAVTAKDAVGWRTTWIGVGMVLTIVLLPAVVVLLRGHGERHAAFLRGVAADDAGDVVAPRDRSADWSARQVVKDARFWAVVPAVVAPAFLMTGFFFHQVHVVESKGWDLTWYALCFTGFAASQTISTLAAGALVDRLGAHRLLPFFLLPMAAGLLVLARFGAAPMAMVYLVLAGVSAGASRPLGSSLWAEAYGTAHLGSIRSVMTALFVLSTAASPVLLGRWIDAGVTVETLAFGGVGYILVATALAAFAFRHGARPQAALGR